jgi:NarL family two-component system response regulator LiaR
MHMKTQAKEHPPIIRVVLVDDHEAVLNAIAALLRTAHDLRLVGQAFSGEDAVTLCGLVRPDVILMDVILPRMSGVESTRAILDQNPGAKIVALSSANEYADIKNMMESGAVGYLIKDAIADSLLDTIRAAYHGTTVFSEQAAKTMYASAISADFGLTARELEVLRLMAQGSSDQEAAGQLGISHFTIRYHIKNILAKMEVTTRAEALVMAAKNNLI